MRLVEDLMMLLIVISDVPKLQCKDIVKNPDNYFGISKLRDIGVYIADILTGNRITSFKK